MSPSPRRGPTPTPSRRPEDAPRPVLKPGRPGRRDEDPTRHLSHHPAGFQAEVLERGDGDGLDDAVELEAERLFANAENLAPGNTWAWALEQANRRIRGAR